MQIAAIHLTSVVTWPTVTGARFQGGAASAGVRPHRPADHGAARAAGIPGSSGRTASAPVRVSRKAQALRTTCTPGNLVRTTAGNTQHMNAPQTGSAALKKKNSRRSVKM